MNERERQALRILRELLDHDADAQQAVLHRLCAGDRALTERVEQLLRVAEEVAGEDDTSGGQPITDPYLDLRLGPFRLVERIGRGGMGVIYRGERESDQIRQTVAIKLIRRGFDFDDVQARFLRERQILARLNHPNLARFIDGGIAPDGRPWFALEYIQGEALDRWCDARRLPIRERMRLMVQICTAVQYAHTQLVVHRDLKPGNILVEASGTPCLLDFGLARLLAGDGEQAATRTTLLGATALTPEYAAPEQFAGTPGGVASDVYALGVIAYELVSGVLPHELDRADPAQAASQVRDTEPQAVAQAISRRRSDVDDKAIEQRLHARAISLAGYRRLVRGDLSRIIQTALAIEPERRYATVDAFADDLRRWLAGAPVKVAGNRLGYRLGKFVRRNRVAVTVAAGLLLALLATSIVAMRYAWQARQQADLALAELDRSNAVRDYVTLMFRTASESRDGASVSARDVLRDGADHLVERFQDDPATGATTALMLAELFLMLGDSEGATPLLERIVEWPEGAIAADVLAQSRYTLAQACYFRGDNDRARHLLAQASAWWQGQGLRYRNRINESRVLQSQLERAAGDLPAAIATLEQAIHERSRTLRLEDRELAVMSGTLALALIQAGRYEEAFRQADDSHRLFARLGIDRSGVGLGAINNRAVAAMHLGRFDQGSADFRLVVDILGELYGESAQLAAAQNNLALSLHRQERFDEAEPLFRSALRIAIAKEGEQGRSTLMPRINLVETLVSLGRRDEALPLAETALEIATRAHGTDRQTVGLAHRARASARAAHGDLAGARADIDRAQAVFTAMGAGGEVHLRNLQRLREQLDTS